MAHSVTEVTFCIGGGGISVQNQDVSAYVQYVCVLSPSSAVGNLFLLCKGLDRFIIKNEILKS